MTSRSLTTCTTGYSSDSLASYIFGEILLQMFTYF